MKILIISGAGVLAGTHIYNKLVKSLVQLEKFKKDSDFPEIVLYNYPFKSIKDDGYFDYNLAREELEAILKKFTDFEHIIIACNTFHLIDLTYKCDLSLPWHALNEFKSIQNTEKKALALCSAYSREGNLFSAERIIYPTVEVNEFVDKLIAENICTYNQYKKENFDKLNEFINKERVTHLIVGCTELSMLDWTDFVNIPIIDSSNVVIKNILNKIERER